MLMEITFNDTGTVITSGGDFDIKKTFECGQCFRFDPDGDGYTGTAFGRVLHLTQYGDTVTLCGVGKEDFKNIWEPFFDIDRDYSGISHDMCTDDTLSRAYGYSRGIRILAQDPWETLCSFIISQNNNIPRIKKIIGLLCMNFGERIQGTQYYSFPSARRIADAGMEALDVIRSGFRSKYIYDAAVKVADGSIDLELLKTLPYEEAKSALMSIKGVGEKVANCVLLFSLGFYGAFPVDVWVKKVIIKYYGDDFDSARFGKYAGIAQQYLFYYERSLGNEKQL